MSDRLPAVTGAQLIAALKREGWFVKRIRGSHHVLRHPSIPRAVPVPVHGSRPLKRGTLLGILRAAGLSRDDLQRLLS